jgi:serine/threonine protein kinase
MASVQAGPNMRYYPKVPLGAPMQRVRSTLTRDPNHAPPSTLTLFVRQVYRGILKNGTKVAIKLQQHGASQSTEKEMELLRTLAHKNVVRNLEFCTTSTDHVLALELCYGTVEDLCDRDLGKPVLLDMAKQTVDALRYLHMDANIAHRDLKPSNVL